MESAPKTRNPLEASVNREEADSLFLFDRVRNPVVRKQIIDLLDASEQSRAGDLVKYVQFDEHDKVVVDEQGEVVFFERPFEPKPRPEIESELSERLEEVMRDTPITFESEAYPHVGLDRELIPINWEHPYTGEKATSRMQAITEAHEKGHYIRMYFSDYLDQHFRRGFDTTAFIFTELDYQAYLKQSDKVEGVPEPTFEEAKSNHIEYLFSATEIAERMSQLKNYFSMRGADQFTKEHLEYARVHYVANTGLDNGMTHFFAAITPARESEFLELINTGGI